MRAYLGANRRFEQAQRLVNAVFTGAWLGVMDRETLAQLDASFYSTRLVTVEGAAVKYSDPEHIRSGLTEWEAGALKAYFPPGGRLVITGAGAGREVLGALELGFEPVGYEPHAELREAGNDVLVADGRAPALRPCERDRFPADLVSADAVLVGWTSYSHIPGAGRRVAFLRAARRVLDPGSALLMSFWMLPGRQRYLRAVQLTASLGRRLSNGEAVEHGDLLSPMFVHCFSEREIRDECAAAGFAVEAFQVAPYPHAVARAV